MKVRGLILAILLLAGACTPKEKTINFPTVEASTTTSVIIEKVEMTDSLTTLHLEDSCCLVEIGRTTWCRCDIVEHLLLTMRTCDTDSYRVVCGMSDVLVSTVDYIVVTLGIRTRTDKQRGECRKNH